jgi:putative aldouronate transport system substrate-binding protein
MKVRRLLNFTYLLLFVLAAGACQAPAPPAPPPAADAEPVSTDMAAKYDPPVTITIGRWQDSAYKFIEGEDWENNKWQQYFLDKLGVETDHAFVVDGSEYENKTNLIIASGDMPDTMFVNWKQLTMLIEEDMIEDMTDVFDQYATDLSKSIYDPVVLEAAKVDGRLWGIPMSGSIYDQTKVIWIRNDWLKNVGLEPPQTYAELRAIAEAFVNDDPDGNGQDDTFAFSVDKQPFGLYNSAPNWHELTGLATAFHAYPNTWVKDADGKLVYGSTTPAMKAALAEMADLYAQGMIDPEFVVRDETATTEFLGGNKAGIVFGAVWAPFWGLGDHMAKQPEADWRPYALVSNDDQVAKPRASLPLGNFAVVRKGYEHPEALVKMFNLINEIYWGPLTPEQDAFLTDEYGPKYADFGAMPFLYSYPYMEIPTINLISHEQIGRAVEADSLEVIDEIIPMNKAMTQQAWNYLKDGDIAYWWVPTIFIGPDSGQAIHQANYDAGNVLLSEFYGAPTPTMVERMSTLDQMQQEVFTKIIAGTLPLEAFDKFVTDWYALGGEDITAEVNDWYASK